MAVSLAGMQAAVCRSSCAVSRTARAMSTPNIRVLLCHERAALRVGLKRLLDAVSGIDVVATAAEGQEGVEATARLRPDVVLIDLSMPRVDGVSRSSGLRSAS